MGKHKPGKGRSAKKARKGLNSEATEEDFKKCPHSFVVNRGHVGKNVSRLIMDVRRVLEPFTAAHLKVRRNNVLKDFINIAGNFNVSHILTFSKTEISTNLRIMRLPRGPTLTFKVNSYSLSRDVISSLKRHNMEAKQFQHHPLLVLNHFSGEGMHMKLMASMFQNMFPPITVNKVKLNDIRRCVLLNYNQENQTIDFRHYNIRVVPVGMSKAVKKLVGTKVPNMADYNDMSEYVLRSGNLSESEAELDGPQNEVTLTQHLSGRGNIKSAKSAIRLTEIGPRLTLQLVKIEEGVCSGDVLYHEFVQKTDEELQSLKEMRTRKRKLKEARKKEQDENVAKKRKLKEELKKKSLAGMEKSSKELNKDSAAADDDDDSVDAKVDSDDDAEYFRQEVGQEPDSELFPAKKKRKFSGGKNRDKTPFNKRRRTDSKDRNVGGQKNKFGFKEHRRNSQERSGQERSGQEQKPFKGGSRGKKFVKRNDGDRKSFKQDSRGKARVNTNNRGHKKFDHSRKRN